MPCKFKVAVCQLKVTEDKLQNIEAAEKMIKEASRAGAAVVVLPEMFNCPYQAKKFPAYAEEYPNGESIVMMRKSARENKVYLIGGSIPEKDGEKVYNTSFLFGPEGELLGKHRKLHLFDVDLPGGIKVLESSTLNSGENITVVQTPYGKIGVAICYDIRFPELARLMALKGAVLVAVPGAFNMTTGPAHWELIFRMRAVDNQIFMIGASPARDIKAGYVAYGHSLVVDPWGNILSQAGSGEKIIFAEIDLGQLLKIRRELPLLRHLRSDIYSLEDFTNRPHHHND